MNMSVCDADPATAIAPERRKVRFRWWLQAPVARSRRVLRAQYVEDADAAAGSKQRHVVDRDILSSASRVAQSYANTHQHERGNSEEGTGRLAW